MDPEVLDRAVAPRHVDRVLPARREHADDRAPLPLPRAALRLSGRAASVPRRLLAGPAGEGRSPPSSISSSSRPRSPTARIGVVGGKERAWRVGSGRTRTLDTSPRGHRLRLQLDRPGLRRALPGDRLGDRRHRRPRLEQDLVELVHGVGLHDDRPAGADRGPAGAHHDRADDDAEVDRAVDPEPADRAGVDAARLGLEVVDDLHRADLRRAGDRAAGEAGAGALGRASAVLEHAAHGRDQLVHGGVVLDDHSSGTPTQPTSPTRPRSLRSRSTIIRCSA